MEREHWEYEDEADDLRIEGEFNEAGEYYTIAAYRILGDGLPSKYGVKFSRGVGTMLYAALCYRLGGQIDRCVNRSEQGILVAEDMRSRVLELPDEEFYDHARRGAWDEFIGDFRTVGGLDHADSAYKSAEQLYREGNDPDIGFAEQEHLNLVSFFETTLLGAGYDTDEWYDTKQEMTLTEWIDHKRTHLPELIDELVESGGWASD